jgi:nucleoside-diphosphate-sugar epimerase
MVVLGDGQQARDFADDVGEVLARCGRDEGVAGSILNIGSGVEVCISDLVDTLERVLGRPVHRLFNPEDASGVSHLAADTALARNRIGFLPSVSLAEGLRLARQRDSRFSPYGWRASRPAGL